MLFPVKMGGPSLEVEQEGAEGHFVLFAGADTVEMHRYSNPPTW